MNAGIQPRVEKLEPISIPKPNPKVEIVHDPDPVTSYRLTRDAHAAKLGGDVGKANDAMMGDREASELFKLQHVLAATATPRPRT